MGRPRVKMQADGQARDEVAGQADVLREVELVAVAVPSGPDSSFTAAFIQQASILIPSARSGRAGGPEWLAERCTVFVRFRIL